MNPYAAFGLGCLLGGIGWWLQARRDRRVLGERTYTIVGYLVEVFALHDGRWAPYLARSLAGWCKRVLQEESIKDAALVLHFAAMLEALQFQFGLTFDGEKFHAKAPPRPKPDSATTSEVNTENEGEASNEYD